MRSYIEALENRRLYSQVSSFRWAWTSVGGYSTTMGQSITLSYSIVPDGTAIPSGEGEPAAASELQADLNGIYGNKATWLPVIQKVFDAWSATTGVTFVYEPNDDGKPMGNLNNGQVGIRGDVRISAHKIDGSFGVLAYNYFPANGDMVLDAADLKSGGFMTNTASNSLALRNVMAHESGHGLGLNHVAPINGTKLMEALASTSFDGPQFDDILGVQRDYGDWLDKGAGNGTMNSATNITGNYSNLSINTINDLDYFKFTLTSTKQDAITITPLGTPYLEGAENTAGTTFDPRKQMDLQFQVLDGNGNVVKTVNTGGVGTVESTSLTLNAGTYYVKVMPAAGATDKIQMYSFSATQVDTPTTTVNVVNNNLTITDTTNKNDNLAVTFDSLNNRYVITDPYNLIGTSIPGATGNGTHTVNVPLSAFTGGVNVNSLGGDDYLDVNNGTSTRVVTLDGGTGTDTLVVDEASTPVVVLASSGNDSLWVNTDNTGTAKVNLATTQTFSRITIGAGGLLSLTNQGINLVAQNLFITGTGKLDLNRKNDLFLDYGSESPIGNWNGSSYSGISDMIAKGQIIASNKTAQAALGTAEAYQVVNFNGNLTAVFDGQTVDQTTVIVKYTVKGDANLDGRLNIEDYGRIDSFVGLSQGNPSVNCWFNGDFNYDGKIDVLDYGIIDSLIGLSPWNL
jgi:hypothetical protein